MPRSISMNPDIGVVQRRVDLVEQTERARLVLEHGEHQRESP